NVRVPYQTQPDTTAQLTINNNGQTATVSFPVTSTAPGIFTDQRGAPVPDSAGVRGQFITLYVTGVGAVSPAVATGAAPAAGTAVGNLPRPPQPGVVTVGGVAAPVQFARGPAGLGRGGPINYQGSFRAVIGPPPLLVS